MRSTILLIDDDADDREFFLEAVHTVCDIECQCAVNGRDALDLLKKTEALPDFIFLDLNMPKMNGWECLREIKKHKRLSNIPVIVYSTAYHEEDIELLKKLKGDYLIRKPVEFEVLCSTIQGVVNGDLERIKSARRTLIYHN